MDSLNLDQLRAFVDVVSSGSFSATAIRHNVSQPAISFQVRQLEKRLGVRLIERVGRKAMPTSAGLELLEYAARINGEVEAALEAMARHAGGVLGRVRLGTGATACIFLLPPLLRDLRTRFPDLEITVTTGNTAEIVKAVEENALDVALVTMPAAGRILSVDVVMEDEFVLVAPANAELPKRIAPGMLTALPLILFEPSGNTRRIVDHWLSAHGVDLNPVMSLGSVEAIKELVGVGLGYAILPAMAMRRVEIGSLFMTRPLAPRLHRKLAVVVRKDKVLHRSLREVWTALQRQALHRG
jgi:DNA-binding transcriptional LysR family regulator